MRSLVKTKLSLSAIADILIILQPLLGGLVYLSLLAGYPPLWASWLIFLTPFLLRKYRWGMTIKRTPFDIPIVFLIIGLLVGVGVSPNRSVSLEALQTYLVCIVGFYAGVANGVRINWYWAFGVIVTLLSFIALAGVTFASIGPGRKVLPINQWLYQAGARLPLNTDIFLNSNALGVAMGISVTGFLAFALLSREPAKRLVAGLLAALCAIVLIVSASGNGLVAAVVGAGLLLLLWKPWTLVLFVPAAWFGLWLATSHFYPLDAARWWSPIPIPSVESRFGIWQSTLVMLKGHVSMGVGLGTWFEQYPFQSLNNKLPTDPHNDLLQLWSDTGLNGGLAMLGAAAIFVMLTWRVWHSPKQSLWSVLALGSAVAMVAFATDGIFETAISSPIIETYSRAAVDSYHFVAVPLIWVLAWLFSVAYMRAEGEGSFQSPNHHQELSGATAPDEKAPRSLVSPPPHEGRQ